ncbi:MAG: preprotein translocase subunit YajC [Holophagales bacterium]|nr:preprotein translocase subunit YajC [Holophagales bacterium]
MTSSLWNLLPAQAASQPSPLIQLMPMFLIFLVFYVIWFLPMRKKQKEHDQVLANLKKGDRVVTTAVSSARW